MTFVSINPTTGEVGSSFPALTERELDGKLEEAARAFRLRRSGDLDQRVRGLRAAASILDTEKGRLARIMVEEMGKTLPAAVAEAEKCARVCRHYAEHAASYLADEPLPGEGADSYLRYLPLGPILAVMPWNFPFWQVFRFAAPALAAGNVALLKHAHNVPRCALAIEELFRRAGFAEGVFTTLLLESAQVEGIIADPRVAAVTLTGSERAGSSVGAAAGKALKKSVLELGGSDPFIVMPSAALDEAVPIAVLARNINNGQSCIAAKRFILHQDIYAEFERRFVEALRDLTVGDPLQEGTDLGPLATKSGLEALDRQVRESVQKGARLLLGGAPLPGPGFFYPPTVLADIPREAPAYREELFGPVALLFRVESLEHAVTLANATPYGLGSSVWTTDAGEQRRFIDELEAGQTFVNAMVASDPRLPFGGIKRSGYGRELAALGMREFMNAKTVFIQRQKASRREQTE